MRSVPFRAVFTAAMLASAISLATPVSAETLASIVSQIEEILAADDPQSAELLAREALAQAIAESGPQSAEAANLHRLLGDSLYSQDRLEDAETEFRAAYDLRRQLLTAPDVDLAISTNDLAIVLRRLGRPEEAEPLYRDVAAQRLALFGPDHPNAARAQFWVARIIDAQSRFGEAAAAMAGAIALARSAFGPADPTTIDWMWEYAAMLHDADDPAAEFAYLAVIDTGTSVLPTDDATLAAARHGLGNFYYQKDRAAEAVPLLRTALAAREATLGPNDEATLFTIDRLARSLWQLDEIAEADALFQRLLATREAAGETDSAQIADLLRWIGRAASSENRRADAERAYKRALSISETVLGPDHVLTAFDLLALGQLYSGQQRLGEARPLLTRAVDILAASADTLSSASVARMALSFLEFADGNASLAATLAERSLAETTLLRGERSREVADIMLTLAGYRHEAGLEPDSIEPLIISARDIYAETAPGSRAALRATSELGRLRQDEGRLDEALLLHKEVLDALVARYGEDATQIQPALADLGDTSFRRADYRAAAAYYERTVAITERLAAIDAAAIFAARIGDVEDQAVARAGTFDHLVMTYHRLADADPAAADDLAAKAFRIAQRVTESQAAHALAQMAARQASGSGELAALVRQRQDLAAQWQQTDAKLTAALGADASADVAPLRSSLSSIDTHIAAIDTELATRFPSFADLQRPGLMSVEQIQSTLADEEVLLYFADTSGLGDTPGETYLWLVPKSGPMVWRRLSRSSGEIAAGVRELRASMGVGTETRGPTAIVGQRDNASRLLTAATNLHEVLLGDIGPAIAGKSLIIVPSRSLAPLPFSALVSELPAADAPDRFATARWLARDHAVTILPAVASLAIPPRTAPDQTQRTPYLAFANPLLIGASGEDRSAFDRTDCTPLAHLAASSPAVALPPEANALFRGAGADVEAVRRLVPLPETTDEVCAIADSLGAGETDVHLGAAATETSLQSLSAAGTLAEAHVVHFATHGLVSGDLVGLAEPALVMTPPEGAAGGGDDGLLTASEVTTLKLDADWVILSACNTASSDGGGEALSGLARAFFYAGAQSLMVSHWPVNSGAAVRLATGAVTAYDADRSASRAEALRQAMLAEIARGGTSAEPSNWAPFIVVGAR